MKKKGVLKFFDILLFFKMSASRSIRLFIERKFGNTFKGVKVLSSYFAATVGLYLFFVDFFRIPIANR